MAGTKLCILIALASTISATSVKSDEHLCSAPQDEVSLLQAKLELKQPGSEEIAYTDNLKDGLSEGRMPNSTILDQGPKPPLKSYDLCKNCAQCKEFYGQHSSFIGRRTLWVRYCPVGKCAMGFWGQEHDWTNTRYGVQAQNCTRCSMGDRCGRRDKCSNGCYRDARCTRTDKYNLIPGNKRKYAMCLPKKEAVTEYLETEEAMLGEWKMVGIPPEFKTKHNWKIIKELGIHQDAITHIKISVAPEGSPTRLQYVEHTEVNGAVQVYHGQVYQDRAETSDSDDYGHSWWTANLYVGKDRGGDESGYIAVYKMRLKGTSKKNQDKLEIKMELKDLNFRSGNDIWDKREWTTPLVATRQDDSASIYATE